MKISLWFRVLWVSVAFGIAAILSGCSGGGSSRTLPIVRATSTDGGAPSTIGLTSSSPNCTSAAGSLTCTLQFPATPGIAQSFTVRTFASLDGSGTPLSLQTVLATIVAGQANQLNFALDGVVSSLSDVSSRLHPYLRPSLLS